MNTIVFGSSFANIFVPLVSTNLEIKKLKGATIKGILNKNKNYDIINEKLNINNYYNGIFVFGNPDCDFYFFKKKYIDNIDDKIIEKNILLNAAKYVKYVSTLKNIKNKYICSVFPQNIILEKDYRKVIEIYGVLDKETTVKVKRNELIYSNRLKRILNFNDILEKECKKYDIKFCNITKYLLNSKNILHKLYRHPLNKYNIHLNFDYILIIYIIKCFPFLITNYEKAIENIKIFNYGYIYDKYQEYNMGINIKIEHLINVDKLEKLISKIDNS